MRIEHVAMYVNDLEAAKNFFEKYLGASANEGYHNKTTDYDMYPESWTHIYELG